VDEERDQYSWHRRFDGRVGVWMEGLRRFEVLDIPQSGIESNL